MTSISTPARALGGLLDLGVAALAAVSIGFLAFAMPDDLFSSLVSASHLPDLVAAAAPPLGAKARMGMILAGAGLSFLLVWSLMRALEGSAEPEAKPARKAPEPDAPRLRRADAHPDAPARRPLIAGADLGEPEVDGDDHDAPRPGFSFQADLAAPEPDPVLHFTPAPADPEPASRLPRFIVPQDEAPAPERNPVVPASEKKSVDPLSARAHEIQEDADSIGSLMQRLERGLADRDESVAGPQPAGEPDLPPPLAQASANPDAALSPEGVRHRLRSAISDLNQIASRG
jgi:hypothetical protein